MCKMRFSYPVTYQKFLKSFDEQWQSISRRVPMPTEAEKLVVSSTKEEKQAAISSCVSQLSQERPDDSHDQIVAI